MNSPPLASDKEAAQRQPLSSALDDGYDSETMVKIETNIRRQVDALKAACF